MKETSKSENSRLFIEAEAIRKSIQLELHSKARNKKKESEEADNVVYMRSISLTNTR